MTAESDDDLLPEDLVELGKLLSLGPSDVADEQPPPSLWASIEAELLAEQSAVDEGASVVSLAEARSRRRFRMALATGAVAAVLLVGIPVGLALSGSDPEPVVLADANLSPVPADFTGSGSAELAERELRVETMGLDPIDDAVYELWLLDLVDGEVNDLVSIGLIDADGTYVIDDAVDLDRFTVVDISIEPTDDDPTHSGNSVLRGELDTL